MWDIVDNADGYYVYRWSYQKEDWIYYGNSDDGVFVDRRPTVWDDAVTAYYIVSAYNSFGESYATSYASLSLNSPKALPPQVQKTAKSGYRDDREIENSNKVFQGRFYTTDYFDYDYTMKQFEEFYEAEQKAFKDWKQQEQSDFEAWKKENEKLK